MLNILSIKKNEGKLSKSYCVKLYSDSFCISNTTFYRTFNSSMLFIPVFLILSRKSMFFCFTCSFIFSFHSRADGFDIMSLIKDNNFCDFVK